MNNEQLFCPLTKLLFYDPVVAGDGHVYEHLAIKEWLKDNNTSPITGYKMGYKLVRVETIKKMVDDFIEKSPDMSSQQFIRKRPFYLFKNDFIDALKNNNLQEILTFTAISLTHKFQDSTIFEYACINCDDDCIIHMINNSTDYNIHDYRGLYPIFSACRYSTDRVIRTLVDRNIDLNIGDNDANRPIDYLLIYHKSTEIIKYLLSKGIELNYYNNQGYTPLSYIIIDGNIELFDIFLNYGVDVDISPRDDIDFMSFVFNYSHNDKFIKHMINSQPIFENSIIFYPEQCLINNQHLTLSEQRELTFIYLNKVFNRTIIDPDYLNNQ